MSVARLPPPAGMTYDDLIETVGKLRAEGQTLKAIAERLGISMARVFRLWHHPYGSAPVTVVLTCDERIRYLMRRGVVP